MDENFIVTVFALEQKFTSHDDADDKDRYRPVPSCVCAVLVVGIRRYSSCHHHYLHRCMLAKEESAADLLLLFDKTKQRRRRIDKADNLN